MSPRSSHSRPTGNSTPADGSGPSDQFTGLRATDLAALLSTQIFDPEDAARYLGIARNSVEYAAYRHRLPYVQYGAKKLFTKADLDDYRLLRGKGRESKLETVESVTVERSSTEPARHPGPTDR